jgi:hypothetical protein
MRLWPQSSQASTWPPRAAVRQISIAAIVFTWPRLSRPVWAARQAAPWRWKMSATSSDGRLTAGSGVRSHRVLWQQPDPVERARDGADRVGGDAGIQCGGLEFGVPELEFGVPEQPRAIMRTFYVIETERFAARDPLLADAAMFSAPDTRQGPLP